MLSVEGRLTDTAFRYDTGFLEKFENNFCFIFFGGFYRNFVKYRNNDYYY